MAENRHAESQSRVVLHANVGLQQPTRQLASGVAHDVSNFLAIIGGFAQFLHAQYAQQPDLADGLREILQAVERATLLVEQLAWLGGRRELELVMVEVDAVIRESVPTLQQALGERIRLEVSLRADTLSAVLDRRQFEQALCTLGMCEALAMPAGGTVILTTQRPTTGPRTVNGSSQVTPASGSAGWVEVNLHGPQAHLDPELLTNLFEPFTKLPGLAAGEGLRLAVAQRLIELHGGRLEVDPDHSKGLTLRCYLPCSS